MMIQHQVWPSLILWMLLVGLMCGIAFDSYSFKREGCERACIREHSTMLRQDEDICTCRNLVSMRRSDPSSLYTLPAADAGRSR